MAVVRARQGDTVDLICYRALGYTAGVTEKVLELNHGLADLGPVLPEGTPVTLPDGDLSRREIDTIQLWT